MFSNHIKNSTAVFNKRRKHGRNKHHKASLTIQAARPVYNSSYSAALINYQDADFTFRYVEYQPVEFNENRVQGSDVLLEAISLQHLPIT